MQFSFTGEVIVKSIEPKSAASRDGRIAVGDQLLMVGKACYSSVCY